MISELPPRDSARALFRARVHRIAARLLSLDEDIEADPLPESLASAHGLLGRADALIDSVILASQRRPL
jgi:hypothetical protein